MEHIRVNMTGDFKKEFGEKYDENNTNHNKKINKMIYENHDKYFKQYQNVAEKYGMKVIFI